ncbi:MAG: hypothetical protein LUB59_00835 [Candidatus Gastranaerophilales bacterium]|nr:hypothetical protein [Candidatus Gastranaerophilales bacterium]
MQKKISLILLSSLISINVTMAASNFSYSSNGQTPVYDQKCYSSTEQSATSGQTLKGRVVTVPAGENVPVISTTAISSSNAYTGQVYSIALASDFYYNGSLIAPAGSSVVGNVVEVSRAKRGSMNGKLCIRFNQIVTPAGLQIPISAVIKTDDGSGTLVGGTKMDVAKDYGKDLVAGSAIGAVSGVVFGALAGGSVGKGAALGTAVGAGGGVVKSIADKGNDVEIPSGAAFDIVLTQPVTTTPASTDTE